MVWPRPDAEGRLAAVVLDAVEAGVDPPYCVHGKTTCYVCEDWVWLGDQTYELVAAGKAAPVCRACAAKHFQGLEPSGRIEDTGRGEAHP